MYMLYMYIYICVYEYFNICVVLEKCQLAISKKDFNPLMFKKQKLCTGSTSTEIVSSLITYTCMCV